jgi:hypothetical protein
LRVRRSSRQGRRPPGYWSDLDADDGYDHRRRRVLTRLSEADYLRDSDDTDEELI